MRALAAGSTVLGPAAATAAVHGLRESRPTTPPAWAARLLSAREREIVALVALGKSNQEIADALVVSAKTVRNHVSSILAKLQVTSRSEVPALWLGVRTPGGVPPQVAAPEDGHPRAAGEHPHAPEDPTASNLATTNRVTPVGHRRVPRRRR